MWPCTTRRLFFIIKKAAYAQRGRLKFEEEASLLIGSDGLTVKELGCTNLKQGMPRVRIAAEWR